MALDTKTIKLSDGTELRICWTWAAAERLRKATGLDLMADAGTKGAALMQQFPIVLHSILIKEDREKYLPVDFEEAIAFSDLERIAEEVFSGMRPKKPEGQQNIPFVNGKAEPDSPLNSPMQ